MPMNTRLAFRITAAATAVGLVVLGLFAAGRWAQERVAAAPPQVVVTVRYPHASASLVETDVTAVLEDALVASASVAHVASTSRDGEAEIAVEGAPSADLATLAEAAADALSRTAALLPSDVEMPTLARGDTPLARCVLTGGEVEDLGEIADWQVRPALESIPGVSRVRIHGARERRVTVSIDLDRAAARGETPLTIAEAITRSLDRAPGGSWVALGDRTIAVGGATTRAVADLGALVIAMHGDAITRVADVASVRDDGVAPLSPARSNGVPAVVLEIRISAGVDAMATQRALRERLAQLSLPASVRADLVGDAVLSPLAARDHPPPLVVRLAWPAGTTLDRAFAASLDAERSVMALDDVASVVAEGASDGRPSVVTWRVTPSGDGAALADRVRDAAVRASPGASVTVLDVAHALGPPIEIDVTGDTAETLAATAADVAQRVRAIDGLGDVRVVPETTASAPQLVLDRARIERYGLEVDRVAREVRIVVEGEEVGALEAAGRTTPIWVGVSPHDPASLRTALRVPTAQGLVPLGELATTASDGAPSEIVRVDRHRAFVVRASHDERERDAVLADVASVLRDVRLAPGVTVTMHGAR